MDQAIEPLPAENPDVRARSGWMRAMQVVEIGVLV
jgi:hypothetical protein